MSGKNLFAIASNINVRYDVALQIHLRNVLPTLQTSYFTFDVSKKKSTRYQYFKEKIRSVRFYVITNIERIISYLQ